MKIANPKNPAEIIETPYGSNGEAAAALRSRLDAREFYKPEFAQDIYASSAKGPSASQVFWLHKLAINGAARPPVKPTLELDLSGLSGMLTKARVNLKRPGILLSVDGKEMKLSLAGPTSKYAGQVMASSPEYGGAYFGRVEDGKFYPGRDSSPAVENLLKRMALYPEETAAEYGRLTGRCCFCSKPLKDERSTRVGYGSTCGKVWGLKWG